MNAKLLLLIACLALAGCTPPSRTYSAEYYPDGKIKHEHWDDGTDFQYDSDGHLTNSVTHF